MSRDEMRARAQELVADWPPLDAQQRAQLATLLSPTKDRRETEAYR
jgi:hypothetical protein